MASSASKPGSMGRAIVGVEGGAFFTETKALTKNRSVIKDTSPSLIFHIM